MTVSKELMQDLNISSMSLSYFDFVPGATSTDNNKVLSIVDGKPAWVAQSSYKIEPITQENYDALTTKDDNTLYIIEV